MHPRPSSNVQLPPPCDDQPYFQVTPLDTGQLQLPEEMLVSDSEPDRRLDVPALSFLLRHTGTKANVLFDLGIKKDLSKYAPAAQERIKQLFSPCKADPDVVQSLQDCEAKLAPTDITHIIVSHVHW
jgi:glyoxylase-like metal-dependent hydrolase (beta-lactamase superfamily II)